MTAGEALALIKSAVRRDAGRLGFTAHALQRMRERRVSEVEVRATIVVSGNCLFGSDDGHWVLFGRTATGVRLRVVFDVEPCVVVTVVKETP